MKNRKNRLECRDTSLLVEVDWNTTTVVDDADVVVRQECHFNPVSKATHRFIARVIKNLPNEVVKTVRTSRPDVHTRTLSYWLESFQNRNRRRVVALFLYAFLSGLFCCGHAETDI